MATKRRAPLSSSVNQLLSDQRRILEAAAKLDGQLRRKANYAGYAVGTKITAGQKVPGLALILLVEKKLAPSQLRPADQLPAAIKVGRRSVPTDVVEISPLRLLGKPCRQPGKGTTTGGRSVYLYLSES